MSQRDALTAMDRFQDRGGTWMCVERISTVALNWPAALFQPFLDDEAKTLKES